MGTRRNKPLKLFLAALAILLLPFFPLQAAGTPSPTGAGLTTGDPSLNEEATAILYRPVETKTSDLGSNTRTLRVLVHYGRTEFFVANGRPFRHGIRSVRGI